MVRILLIFLTITFKQTIWKISISAFWQLIKWFYIILEDKVENLRETVVVFTEKASWISKSWCKLQKITEPGSSTVNSTQTQVCRCQALPSRLLEGSNLHWNPCPLLWPQPSPSVHMEHWFGMSDHICVNMPKFITFTSHQFLLRICLFQPKSLPRLSQSPNPKKPQS